MKNTNNYQIIAFNPVTKRALPEQTTTESVATYEDLSDIGLPFYYFNPQFSMLLIVLGVLILFFRASSGFWFLFFRRRSKKYICPKCNREFIMDKKEPKICQYCHVKLIETSERSDYDRF